MSRIFWEKRLKLSNLEKLVYAESAKKKDFILVSHSNSVDYRTTIQVTEHKYHERLIQSLENAFKMLFGAIDRLTLVCVRYWSISLYYFILVTQPTIFTGKCMLLW